MARSRRRSANRNRSSSGMFNLPNLAKIGSGLLVLGAGTYGVFYTVSNMPSGTRNLTENVEVGDFSTDVAMSRKPPLPDESGNTPGTSPITNTPITNTPTPKSPSFNTPIETPLRTPSLANQTPTVPAKNPLESLGNPAADSSAAGTSPPKPPTNILAGDPTTRPANRPLPDLLTSPGKLPGDLPAVNSSTPPPAAKSGATSGDPLANMLNPASALPAPPAAGNNLPGRSFLGGNPKTNPSVGTATDDLLPKPGNNLENKPTTPDPLTAGSNPMRSSSNPSSNFPTAPNNPLGGTNELLGQNPSLGNANAGQRNGLAGLPVPPATNPLDVLNGRNSQTNPNNVTPDLNRSAPSNLPPASPMGSTTGNSLTSRTPSIGIPPAATNPPSTYNAGGNPLDNRSLPPGSPSSPLGATPPRNNSLAGSGGSGFGNSSVPATPTSQPGNTRIAPRTLTDEQVRPAAFPDAQQNLGPSRPLTDSLVSNQPGDPRWEIQQNAAIILEKHAPEQVQVNVPAKFVLVVRNVGRVPASQVLIRDRVPQGAQLLQATPKPDHQQGDLLEWKIEALPPGETMQITTELMPLQRGELGSVAEVSLAAVASCRTRSTEPKLVIEHSAPPQILVGQQVVMNITVRNDGDGPADDVVIRETVPRHLKHQSGTEIENPIGRLLPGQSRTLQLPLLAVEAGQVKNTVRVTGKGKLSDEHEVNLQVVAPRLQVDMAGPTRRFLSRQAVHEMKVTNNGTANATNVQMMARLPRGLKYESSSPAGRYDPSRHAVFWAIQQLPSGQQETVSITTLPLAPGDQDIEFQALADLNQPQTIKRTLAVEQLSELFFEIDDLHDPIEVNSETTYVVRVENQGSQVANNVELAAMLPAGLEPVNIEAPVEYRVQPAGNGSREIVFAPIGVLNPKSKLAIRIQVRGQQDGDHRIEVRMTSAQRPTAVAKQESTKVYSDLR